MGPFGRRNRLPIDLRHIEIPIHDEAKGEPAIADVASPQSPSAPVEFSDSVTLIHAPKTARSKSSETPKVVSEPKVKPAAPKTIIAIDPLHGSRTYALTKDGRAQLPSEPPKEPTHPYLRPLSNYQSIEKVLPENRLSSRRARLQHYLGRIGARLKKSSKLVAAEPQVEKTHAPRHLNKRRVAYVAAGLAVAAAATALLSQGGSGAESLNEDDLPQTDNRASVSQTLTQAPPAPRAETPARTATVVFAVDERRTMTDVIDRYATMQGADFNGTQNYRAYLTLERSLGLNMIEDAGVKAYETVDGEVRLKKHQDRSVTLSVASQKIINSLITAS